MDHKLLYILIAYAHTNLTNKKEHFRYILYREND